MESSGQADTLPETARLSVREWPASERPREKLRFQGAGALSNAELLAILLRVGLQGEDVLSLSQRLLVRFGGLPGLHQALFETLAEERGIGVAKAATLKAGLELGRRLMLDPGQERLQIRTSADVAQLLIMEMAHLEQECLRTVLLNTKNLVLAVPTIYRGSVNQTSLRVGEVFREAVRANATAIIVVHNHPSGDPTPSHRISGDSRLTSYPDDTASAAESSDRLITTRKPAPISPGAGSLTIQSRWRAHRWLLTA